MKDWCVFTGFASKCKSEKDVFVENEDIPSWKDILEKSNLLNDCLCAKLEDKNIPKLHRTVKTRATCLFLTDESIENEWYVNCLQM